MSVDSVTSRKIHVVQGEHAVVVNEPDTMLTTILGSCVAACIRDAAAGIGGMNHFLLPGRDDAGGQDVRFGVYAMELLINALLRQGASRNRLEAKLFGGARIVAGFSDIGRLNAEFARSFLEKEGIAFAGGSLGGNHARRIQYWPFTGQARQTFIRGGAGEIVRAESRLLARPTPAAQDGVVELF